MMSALNTVRKRFCNNAAGASAVEFALLTPIILLLLAAVVDFGLLISARTKLEAALSSASTHVMASGQQATAESLPELTQTAVGILARQIGETATIMATVDNAVTINYASGALSVSGENSNLGRCFCPSRQTAAVDWGVSMQCGAPCPDSDALAGRYMSLAVSAPHTSIFGGYVVRIDSVGADALVNYQ